MEEETENRFLELAEVSIRDGDNQGTPSPVPGSTEKQGQNGIHSLKKDENR